MAIFLVIGLVLFENVTELVEPEPETNYFAFLILVPIIIIFLLPLILIFRGEFGFIVRPIKKILVWIGLMLSLVKINEGNEKYR